LAEAVINQTTDRNLHQSKHSQKSPFLEIKPINQPFWQKPSSIKPLAEVAIYLNTGKSCHFQTQAEVAICKPA